jgi:glycosyltransferase involved in cell wall biosynthesis
MNNEEKFTYLPKISVITPSYNQANFIERTIESVLNQNYPNLEYIVIDGGSTDGTLEILRKYDTKIIWKSEKDKGIADAINKGLRLAAGEIVAYINSDDLYEMETLKRVGEFFKENLQVMWICGKCRIVRENGREFYRPITWFKNLWLKRYGYNKLFIINFISQPAVFWRRKIIEEIGFFNCNLNFAMDYEYWVRIGEKYKPAIINEYLACFRIHPKAKGTMNYSKQFKEELNIAKQYSPNWLPVFFHYPVYFGIVASYYFLK